MGLLTFSEATDWPSSTARYERHRPETTLLYQVVQQYWPEFKDMLAAQGRTLPGYVHKEFEAYLDCGRLECGFLRVQCEACHSEKLLAISCKRRGYAECGARRMADSAAHLVDEVFPEQPVRQWVLSVPYQLRYLLATQPEVITKVLAIVHRVISTSLIKRAGLAVKSGAQTGAVTLIQLFGSALNLNPHFHLIHVDGVFNRQGHF